MEIDNTDIGLVDERMARLVRLAAREFNRALQIRLSSHGISFGQWIFLRILWTEEGQSQRELSRLAGVTEPTTHTALQKLELLGLVNRRNLSGNQRRQHVFLSEKGHALRDQLEPLAIEVNDVAVAGLDDETQQALRAALLRMIENLKRDEEKAAARGDRMPPTRTSSMET